MIVEVFQILDSIGVPDMRALHRSTRRRGSVFASAVLDFFAAAPVTAPAVVELLLPMAMRLSLGLAGNGGRDAMQEQCARRKTMMAAEWGKQLFPLSFLLSHYGKSQVHPSRTF
jgi:hypothetical protein